VISRLTTFSFDASTGTPATEGRAKIASSRALAWVLAGPCVDIESGLTVELSGAAAAV
jgi:hypothetical protein